MPYSAVPARPITRAPLSVAIAVAGLLLLLLPSSRAQAQTDYYNTDAGRPITVEDAYAIERRAVELQVAPLRLERARGTAAAYAWSLEPEFAVGLLPRTQLEVGFPLAYREGVGGGRASGLAGLDVSMLYNLNVETRTLPALAVVADVLLPVGALAPSKAYPSVKAIATRTFPAARFHLNAQYTLGDRLAAADLEGDAGGAGELSRWLAGIAVDRTFPLRSMLLTAEVVARQPLAESEDVALSTAAGTRYQLSPRVAADAGAGYRLTGADRGWFVTFGAAVALGLPWAGR